MGKAGMYLEQIWDLFDSFQLIPQYAEVPPDIEAAGITSYFSVVSFC
jgi:hypothetical protein